MAVTGNADRLFYLLLKTNHMTKVIFLLWLLSGKVQPQYDAFGVLDMHEGRQLYTMGKHTSLYKGEVLNYIRTGVLHANEMYSDVNGKVMDAPIVYDTLTYYISKKDKTKKTTYLLYREGKKKWYVIDPYTERKVYLKMKK
jgi:hypothetical protein